MCLVKKLLLTCLVLSFAVCLFSLSAQATTERDYQYEVCDGTAAVVKYTGSDSDVTIPATLGGYPVTAIKTSAFSALDSLTSVTIPEGVTTIEGCAIEDCENLTAVNIPNSITHISAMSFEGCTKLPYLIYGNAIYFGNDQNPYMILMLAKDRDIESVEMHADTRIIAGGAFNFCSKLTKIDIPSKVTVIGDGAFYDCKGLTTVIIPSGVMQIGAGAFVGCTSLEKVNYTGSADQWEQIEISENNDLLSNATLVTNYKRRPNLLQPIPVNPTEETTADKETDKKADADENEENTDNKKGALPLVVIAVVVGGMVLVGIAGSAVVLLKKKSQ